MDLLGPTANQFGLTNPLEGEGGWSWDVDFSFGFGPWRKSGSDSQNHQNTTIDHSYYLNRALLDGFFLSGKSSTDNFSILDNKISGERYRPLLWIKNSTNSFTQGSSVEAVGNPRLVAYERENNWIENLTPMSLENL